MASEGRELSRKVLAFFSALLFLAMFMPSGFAAPSNGAVTTGSGTITKSGDTTTISQTSNKLGINWQTFSIGSGETVVFVQPGFSSIALNRVIGSEPSAIYGQLTANGKVFLINPQGILFAPTAQVNVGALAASTLNISDSDFTAGTYTFSGAGGSVINQGSIKAADGGYVALLGGQIVNQGTIVVKSGTIALGAGNAVTLDMAGDGLINLAVSQATVNAQITNNNLLKADGGRILMTARTADELAGTVINNSGTIRANSISTVNGVIRLDGGDQGIVVNTGALSAAGLDDDENGGSITLRGGNVQLDSTTNIDASGTTGGTVKVSAVGDLTISNNLSAGTNANIILRADHNGTGAGTVNFQESGSVALSGSGAAEIYYNPVAYTSPADYAGKVTGGTLTAYMLVNNVNQLQAMNTNLAGAYALGKDIDAGASAAWNSGAGFAPIGSSGKFSGKFNGDGHTISNLYIHRPSQGYVGLFGELTGTVKNVGLVNMSVSGNMYTGALVGLNYGSISNSYSSASVTGYQYVGGLVGDNHVHSSISNCYSSGTVSGTNHVGGLIGGNTYGSISNSYSTSTVSGSSDSQYVGGLVGHNGNDDGLPGGSISNSYSAGAVTSGSGSSDVGGLVGANSGSVSSSFWNKTTSGQTVSDGGTGLTTAGMMNQSNFSGWDFGNTWRIYGGYTYPLLKSFLTPLTVTANDFSRTYNGTTGYAGNAGVSYSATPTGSLFGTLAYGGTAQAAKNAGEYTIVPSGLYSGQQGYDIAYANGTLSIIPRPITITANASRVYGNANPASGPVSVISGSLAGTEALSSASLSSPATAASNVGGYSLTPSGVTFASGSAANYTITYADGTLSITPRPLTVTANNTSRVYGNANPASGTVSLTSGSLAGTDTLGSVAALSSPATAASNVGSYSLTPSGITFIHGSAANYTITYADGTLSITPRPITVTANASRVYGDANPANGPVNVVSGSLVGTDALGNANLVSPAAVTSSVGAYSLTPSAVTLQRGSAANYSISYANGILTITPRPISVTAVGKNKSYDGTTFASVIYNDNRINGDNLTVTGTAAFSDPNPGDDKPVSVTDIRLSGTAAGNYTLQNTFAFTIADIVTRSSSLNKASSFLQPLVQPFFALPAIQAAIGSQNTDEDDWLPEDL